MPDEAGARAEHERRAQHRRALDGEADVHAAVLVPGRRLGRERRVVVDLGALVAGEAREEAVVGVDHLVDLEHVLVVAVGARVVRHEQVVGLAGRVRERHPLQQRQRHRIDPAGGDDVARERIADVLAVLEARRQRIVDGDGAAVGRPRLREVAGALERARHRVDLRERHFAADLLPVVHEEGLVGAVVEPGDLHRSVDGEPRLVPVEAGLLDAAAVGVEGVRVQLLVAVVLVERAVELVGAALQHDVDDAAAGAAVLRVVDARLHLELGGRVGRRHEAQVVRLRRLGAGVRHAVEQELVGVGAAAADLEVVHAAVVERAVGAAGEGGRVLHAGRELRERERIAAEQRQVGHLLAVDDLPAVGTVGVEQRRFGADRHFLGQRPELQGQVEAQAVADPDFDAFASGRREAGQRRRQGVAADGHEREARSCRRCW